MLRLIRLLRLSRIARLAKLLRAVPELMILIKGILFATRSVFCTFALLSICIYVFAVMAGSALGSIACGSCAGFSRRRRYMSG